MVRLSKSGGKEGAVLSLADRASLERLMARIARGEREAFRALYAATAPKLNGVVLRILGNRALAEDCLQEVYLRVWRSADRYDGGKGTVMTWLIAVARNAALDRRRRERPATPLDELPELEALQDGAPDPLANALRGQEGERLRACLQTLEEEPRRCVLLAYWYGFTHEELAARVQRPLGTVKSWVRRSLLRLKECLGA